MKKNWRNKGFLFFLLGIIMFSGCKKEKDQHSTAGEYTCPMHPQIVKNEPGTCPICGMDLVLKSHSAHKGDSVAVREPENFLETITPSLTPPDLEVEVKGMVIYDPRKSSTISALTGGRVEKLYIRYSSQPVKKGQKIMEIYSPEVVTAQKELLYLARSENNDPSLLESSKQKLRLLGVSDKQIKRILTTKEASYSLEVFSPHTGYVVEDNLVTPPPTAPPGSTASMKTMQNTAGSSVGSVTNPGDGFALQEGMYVSKGQSLFTVVTNKSLAVLLNLDSHAGRDVKQGDSVSISTENGKQTFKGKISLLETYYFKDAPFRRSQIYLNVPNNELRPGQLVKTRIRLMQDEQRLWVPAEAVRNLGTRRIVYVRTGKSFRPHAVVPGMTIGKWVEIFNGLQPGQEIAANAQFMVDSDAFVEVE